MLKVAVAWALDCPVVTLSGCHGFVQMISSELCNLLWHAGASSCAGVSCVKKTGLISSRSRSQ